MLIITGQRLFYLTLTNMSLNKKINDLLKNQNDVQTHNLKKISKKELLKKVKEYIKEHAYEYKAFIMDETLSLYKQGKIKRPYEWSHGLYNCDELYSKAIKSCLFH